MTVAELIAKLQEMPQDQIAFEILLEKSADEIQKEVIEEHIRSIECYITKNSLYMKPNTKPYIYKFKKDE